MLAPPLLEQARALFPYTATGRIYLNHAATSPFSTRVAAAMDRHIRESSTGKIDTYPDDVEMLRECRVRVCQLINAESPDRIALSANTSEALNIIAAGLSWTSGDRILLNSAEFPANVYPYVNLKRFGVEVDFLPANRGVVTPDALERLMTPRTRLLGLSAVQFLSGYRADLETIGRLCRKRGVAFAVDGIQAVGAVRIDVQAMKIDALAAGCQKWQMGPRGGGFLYLTEEMQARIRQAHLGWLGVSDPWNFSNFSQQPAAGAQRYESGSWTIPSLYGMNAALEVLLEFGLDAVEDQILDLTGILIDRALGAGNLDLVTPTERSRRAGIVTFGLPSAANPEEVFRRISKRNLTISLREGRLRISPHFYNAPGEMHTTMDVIRECLEKP